MGVCMVCGTNGVPSEVASNTGWGDFCRWVDGLHGFTRLRRLRNTGHCPDAATLRDQLTIALRDCPDPDVCSVAENLLSLLAGEVGPVSITDGMS